MFRRKIATYLLEECLRTTQMRFLRRSKNPLLCLFPVSKYSKQSKKLTMSYTKGTKDNLVLNRTYGQVLEESLEKFSNKLLVFSVEQGVQLSYSEAIYKADRLAAGLLALGLQKGDRVALWAPNTWEWLVVQFALARCGLITVAMNPLLVGEDALHCLTITKIAAVVTPAQHKNIRYFDILEQFAPELRGAKSGSAKCSKFPHLKAAICISGNAPKFAVSIDELCSSSSESDTSRVKKMQTDISPEDAVLYLFSSGTTGKPKSVVISHKSYVNNDNVIAKSLHHDKDKPAVYLVQVPLFHAFGSVAVISANIHLGGKLVLPASSYSPKAHLKALKEHKCTILTGTPTMYLDTIRQTETDGRPTHNPEIGICGGAPLVPQLGKDILDVLKLKRLHAIYGLSETTCAAFTSTPDDTRIHMCNTVGKITPNVEAKVVDRDGKTVPVNTSGELWVRGYLNMTEYFEQPQATKECMTSDGWIKTGDQFIIDEDGYGKVIGRFKDIIIRGGENVNPKEIEDILTLHPSIIDAQVVGVKDDRLGEEICACIITRDSITEKEITDICKDKIAKFKIPKYYVIMDEYPRTTSGKIQKHKIRDQCNKLLKQEKLSTVNT